MTDRKRLLSAPAVALVLASALSAAGSARAQGIIIDRHRIHPIARSYEVREVSIDARIRDQVADVQVSQTFHNPGSFPIDAEFLFPLPEDGAVQSFVLLVDGKELPGRLMPKDEARRVYEEIVRTSRDPALLEYMGRGLFRTSVFPIPPGADRKVTMRYTQLCKRDRDVLEFSDPFGTQKFTAKPIQRLSVSVRLESRESIKSIYCPSDDARIERTGEHEARVTLERRDVIPTTDFRLIVTLAEGALGASLLSTHSSSTDDGYFLLLASPEIRREDVKPRPKTVVFVLDRSGSMAGKKIEQARNALKFVLNNLRDDDTFNIVAYDDRVENFKPELQRYTSETRREALRFVENIREGGATNIDGALRAALGQIPDDSRPNYVIFLTDGLPTAGEVNEAAIADHARGANKPHARIFAFGVGFDVNARLLDRVCAGNSGTSEYVKPDEDIEVHVARFYSRMTSPVLADIRVDFDGGDVTANRTYPRDVPDLFEGGQLVLTGRYNRGGRATIRVSGKVGGERKTYEFPANFARSGEGGSYDFVEKLWATRRVGELIDQIDLHGQNRELIDELVDLSKRYGLLTPYTSFLADDRVQLHANAANSARAENELLALREVGGVSGVNQRGMKQDYKFAARAPSQSTGGAMDSSRLAYESRNEAAPAGVPYTQGMPGMLGRAGGMGGSGGQFAKGSSAASGPAQSYQSGNVYYRDFQGREQVVATVRQVGNKTFFRKDNRWVDATVKPEEDAKSVVIRQFSDDFFKLARAQKAEFNQYLTFEEPVTVNLDGVTYRIEPEKTN